MPHRGGYLDAEGGQQMPQAAG